MTPECLPETNAALAVMMREKLGAGGADRLDVKLKRCTGLLPRTVRRDAKYLIEMEKLCAHPKLARQIDQDKTGRAAANLRRHLDAVDPRDRRMGQILGIVAPLAFNILLVCGVGLGALVWAGHL